MWTQISQSVTAMSQGRHLLGFLPLCIAFMLRGLYRLEAGALLRSRLCQCYVERIGVRRLLAVDS